MKILSWIKSLFRKKEETCFSPVIYEETNFCHGLPTIEKTIQGKKEQAWKDDIWKNRFKAD